jgi:hypothetical protein
VREAHTIHWHNAAQRALIPNGIQSLPFGYVNMFQGSDNFSFLGEALTGITVQWAVSRRMSFKARSRFIGADGRDRQPQFYPARSSSWWLRPSWPGYRDPITARQN